MGFVCTVAAYVVTLIISPNMTDPLPRWACCFCGIATFAYQTLDNIDGSVARRTTGGSVLGEMFDHGCDALMVHVRRPD